MSLVNHLQRKLKQEQQEARKKAKKAREKAARRAAGLTDDDSDENQHSSDSDSTDIADPLLGITDEMSRIVDGWMTNPSNAPRDSADIFARALDPGCGPGARRRAPKKPTTSLAPGVNEALDRSIMRSKRRAARDADDEADDEEYAKQAEQRLMRAEFAAANSDSSDDDSEQAGRSAVGASRERKLTHKAHVHPRLLGRKQRKKQKIA